MVYAGNSTELTQVVDTAGGRSLHFHYIDGRISSITLFKGNRDHGVKVSYAHDENGNLTAVTYPDGSGFNYYYEDDQKDPNSTGHINNLTRKTDAQGHLLSTWTYDAFDRCMENNTFDDRGVAVDYSNMPDRVTVTDAYDVSKSKALS
jgi:YD repeat-containing protein